MMQEREQATQLEQGIRRIIVGVGVRNSIDPREVVRMLDVALARPIREAVALLDFDGDSERKARR